MFDELASIFFFSSAGGDADSYRAAATKPETPAGSPSPARAAAGGSRCGSASQGFPRPALSSRQLTFGIQLYQAAGSEKGLCRLQRDLPDCRLHTGHERRRNAQVAYPEL